MILNFDIPEDNLWWRLSYWPYKNEAIFSLIQRFNRDILDSKNETEFIKELCEIENYYRADYILKCLKGEKNIDESIQVDDILNIIENRKTKLSRNEIKILNMYNAMCYIFPDSFVPFLDTTYFTVDLAITLHKLTCNDLLNNCGEFRTKPCSPSNENYEYVRPDEIQPRLAHLFEETRKLLKENKLSSIDKIELQIKIAACFFAEFLDIHPFVNGNGRVARLLLSYILSDICVVPIALYNSTQSNRSIYLTCLRESRNGDYSDKKLVKPEALSAYILESILRNIGGCEV